MRINYYNVKHVMFVLVLSVLRLLVKRRPPIVINPREHETKVM